MGQLYSRCIGPFIRGDSSGGGAGNRADAYKVDANNTDAAAVTQPKAYSWDTKKDKTDPMNYIFDELDGIVTGKLPGSINGQQFVIQNCKNSTLYLYDNSATVTVDDCENCKIYIGPCKGSVCIRDTKSCSFAIACQQFRTRDCEDLDVFLLCSTQPIIESSKNIRFACLQMNYGQFAEQLEAAELEVFNNTWSKVHDFTPTHGNCSCLPEEENVLKYIPFEDEQSFSGPATIDTSRSASLVPLSLGLRPAPSKQIVFLLCFCDETGVRGLRERCLSLIKSVQVDEKTRLVLTKEVTADSVGIERILGTDAYKEAVKKGAIIGMEWNGAEAASRVGSWLEKEDRPGFAYLAVDAPSAKQQLAKFYSFADMKHGV